MNILMLLCRRKIVEERKKKKEKDVGSVGDGRTGRSERLGGHLVPPPRLPPLINRDVRPASKGV
jgi:hypothetical protein